MADAQYGEGRQFNLAASGTDLVEGSAIAVEGATGALTVDGLVVGSTVGLAVAIVDASGNQITTFGGSAVGDVAHDAVDSGNPVKIGGRVSGNGGFTAVAVGDRSDAWLTSNGAQVVTLMSSNSSASDAMSTPIISLPDSSGGSRAAIFGAAGFVFNGTTFDRARGNTTAPFVHGPTAHDAAFAGNPLAVGAYASAAIPSAVSADGDLTRLWAGTRGQLATMLVDASGNTVSVGGGTQYAVDAALGATPTGTLSIGIRDDALTTLTPIEGDAVGLRVGDKGALWVQIADGSGNQITSFGGGTQYVGDAPASDTPTGTMMMGRYESTLPTLVSADGDAVAAWLSAAGTQQIHIRGQDELTVADVIGQTNANGLAVAIIDGSGNQITSFGGGTQYVEDVALGTVGTPTGTLSMGRASVAAPSTVSADADAAALWVSRFGALNVILRDTSGGAITTGVQYIEDSAITANAGQGTLVVGRRDDALSTLTPAENDAVGLRVNSRGALWVSTDPVPDDVTTKTAQYTTTQTGAALWTPAAGKRVVVTEVQIQAGGTTAGSLQLWFGASADTTYTRGTDRAIFDGEFAPSSTNKPGVVMHGKWMAGAADHVLRVTDSAAINPLTVTVWGYEV